MKPSQFLCMVLLLLLLGSCGAGETASSDSTGGYLDSTYVSKTYRVAMDSIRNGSGITPEDFKLLQGFMRDHREEIQGNPTYRSLLESAKGIKSMDDPLAVEVESVSLTKVQKLTEIRLVLKFQNKLAKAIGKFRGRIAWLDAEGKVVTHSPAFTVVGPIAAGEALGQLRLEYALYKATGNELNDPKLQAQRDTLEMVEELYKRKDLKAFSLQVLDFELANGINPVAYWMMAPAEREKLQDQPGMKTSQRTPLMKWADAHEELLTQLKSHDSPMSILISPVLTERVEVSHGKNLILDRQAKVFAFFNETKQIPRGNIHGATKGRRLVLGEIIDFWDWPMEVRIYTTAES